MSITEFCLEQSWVTDMKIADKASMDDNTHGGGERPPCTGLIPDVLPDIRKPVLAESSRSGVSTKNTQSETGPDVLKSEPQATAHWYALRATYGREKKAYEFLVDKHVEAYYPTIKTVKEIGGKRTTIEESRLPNIFFARGTEKEIKSYVYDNVNLPYLRFYYQHLHDGVRVIKKPLIVPDYQIESLKIICASEAQDIILEPTTIQKFQKGQKVRVVDGVFKGVTGVIARYQGQQRVGIIIDGLLTIASAYVPSAFIEKF